MRYSTELYTADLTDNRRFAAPITPWQRGFEDATYEQTYANPYRPGTDAYAAYDCAFRQAITDCRLLALGATLRRRSPVHISSPGRGYTPHHPGPRPALSGAIPYV